MNSLAERIAWYRAEQYIARYRPYMIAIAGTYGCTMASQAMTLAVKNHRHVRQGYEAKTSLDIPESILGVEAHKREMGLMRFLAGSAMKELSEYEPDTIIAHVPLLKPHFARKVISRILPRMLVIPHIGSERIDLFGSREIVAHEYASLAGMLGQDGVLVLNADDEYAPAIRESVSCPIITYGTGKIADISLQRASRGEDGSGLFLEIAVDGTGYELFAPNIFAKQHIYGLLAGLAAAHGLGIHLKDAVAGLSHVQAARGVLQKRAGIRGAVLIDDTAALCPERLASSLKTFASLPCQGRKIAVLGDMENLGSQTVQAHAQAAADAASAAQIIIFIGEHMRHAQKEVSKSEHAIDTHHFVASAEAAPWLAEHVREHDLIYIAGGEQMNMQEVVQALSA